MINNKTILITGAKGFVGKNLITHLKAIENYTILSYDIDNTLKDLESFIEKSDFIIHLAGVNRPKEQTDFSVGNKGFTNQVISIIEQKNKKIPLLISSSIQAALDNPYGISKKEAEKAVFKYAQRTGAEVCIYRLPNVFGKWCRPNYNSAVATFCHNIANNLTIQINDPNTEISLVYIDDVVEEFVNALRGRANKKLDGFCEVKRTFKVTLQQLSDTIYSFSESRKNLIMPNFTGDFERFLYASYISYLNEDNFGYKLDMKHDNRGWLAEFIKSKSFGQIFISRTKPGITRGNHWHHTKVEKFLVIEGEAVIKFRQMDSDKVIEYKVSGKELKVLDIPTGYTHSISNIGETDVITLFWSDEIFNPEKMDTYFLEV